MKPPTPDDSTPAPQPRLPTADDLADDLRRHLPKPPARLLLLAPVDGDDGAETAAVDVADLLADAGFQVVRGSLPTPPSESGDAGLPSPGLPAPPHQASMEPGPPEADRPESNTPDLDAALLLAPPLHRFPSAWLEALRPRIRDGGRLVVAGALADAARHELVRGLFEHRFALLRERARDDGGRLLVARPAHHRVRPYRPGDETAILDLFQRAFHVRRSVERWRWAYEHNPHGNHRISVAVDGEGRLLAHYAGYPMVFWTDLGGGERRLPCVHVGDTMTDPDARRVGRGRTNLLSRTVEHFFATWSWGRTAFNYGSNTGKIHRFSRRTAQGRTVEAMPHRVLPVDPVDRPIAAPGRLAARLGGWRVEPVAAPAGFDGRWDELWERCRGAYRFLVERDARYLRWRYACPGVTYHPWAVFRRRRLVGWSVFRQEEDRLVWGDALFDPAEPGAPAMLLSRVLAAAPHRHSRRVEGWLTPRPDWWAEAVHRLGFRPEPEPQDLALIYAAYEFEPDSWMDDHLYYTKADFDLF